MLKSKSSLVVVLVSSCITCLGQTQNDFLSLKNFIPPSPEAQAISRYGEIPVDLSTGVPSISIPVYEIKSRKFTLPVSLSYHASGIKVEDMATPAGLGWVVNASGQISRSVVGKADETGFWVTGYKNRSYFENLMYNPSSGDMSYLNNLANGTYDIQSDIYNFNFNSIAGRFVYDTNGIIHYTPVDRQLKIQRTSNLFTILDDQGSLYEFMVTDTSITLPSDNITTWHLSRMISADKTDTITFQYISASSFSDTSTSNSFFAKAPRNTASGENCALLSATYQTNEQQSWVIHKRKLLDKIVFAGGYVKFEYVSDREDGIPERLSKIQIFDASDNLIKEVRLLHDYFGAGNAKRLKLTKVIFTGTDTTLQFPFRFDYEESISLPSRRSREMDFWGYYNGNGSGSLLPKNYQQYLGHFFDNIYYPGTNDNIIEDYEDEAGERYANPLYTQAWTLKRITYPTGGTSTFEYENNKGPNLYGGNKDYVGGLRIKRVTSYDSVAQKSVVKSYKYDSAVVIARVVPDDFYYEKRTVYPIPNTAAVCYSADFYVNANPINPIKYYNGSAIIYYKVTEFNGDSSVNAGKTEYIYDTETDSSYSFDDIKKYWNFSVDRNWARGNLLNTKIFKNQGGNYSLVKEIKNYYDSKGLKWIKVGQVCEQMVDVYGSTLEGYMVNVYNAPSLYPGGDRYYLTFFDYIDVILPFGVKKLIKTEEIDYLNNAITKKQEILYESVSHLYPTKKLIYTSITGDTLKQITKYPQDKASISNLSSNASSALDSMISCNIRMVPAEMETYKNSQLLTRNRIEYRNWNSSNRFYEEYLSTQVKQNAMEQRVQYKDYDERGNIISLGYINDHDISYIWDHNKTLAIAQVLNASASNIAYTSFESDGKGNWSFSGAVSTDNTSPSGSKVYALSGGNVTKSGLSNITYVISYWGKNGAQNVNGASATSGRSLDGWTYYEHSVTNPASGLVTVSGSGTIDDLRVYPKGALMKTYVYKPLVGLISQSDANNRMTYYFYDNLNRLAYIKDQDKNVIKKIAYKYGESIDSTINYYNQQKSGIFTKNNCGSGYAGTQVTYVVPAGTHMSRISVEDANNLAQININTNGQSYANTNGSCQLLYYNVVKSGNFTRNNCPSGYTGSTVTYTVPAGTYSSVISQAYVDGLAQSDVNANGQAHANATGTCNVTCTSGNCFGPANKCINDTTCELGVKVYTSSYYDSGLGQWVCTYHYEWSDSTWSENYIEYSETECETES